MQSYQILGVIAAILVVVIFIPHCYQSIKAKQSNVLSALQLAILLIASVLWGLYGIRDSSPAIVLLAVFSLSVSTILLAQKRRQPNTT